MDTSKLLDRCDQAFERSNWDLAIMLLQQVLEAEPGNLKARKLIREAGNRKCLAAGEGGSAKAKAVAQSVGPMAAYSIHMLTKKYDKAMMDCEKALINDPNNGVLLLALVKAAVKGGYTDAAIATLEYVRDHKQKNIKALRQLGLLYEQQKMASEAIATWERVKSFIPTDREAAMKLRDLAAMKTMVDGRYDTATQKDATFHVSKKSAADSAAREAGHKIDRTEEDIRNSIARVTKDVEEHPGEKRFIIQLGDLYARIGEIPKARELYGQAKVIDAMDFGIDDRLGDLDIDEYAAREVAAQEKVKASPEDAAAKAELAEAQKQRFDFEMKEYRRRIETRPTDPEPRVKLGDLYYKAKMYDEAAVEFQKASAEPKLYRECRTKVGLCLFYTGKYQLAAGQFEQAIRGGNATMKVVRDIMYNLALTFEKLNNLDGALEYYQKIFDADMSYKDVRTRLDKVMHARAARQSSNPQAGGESA